MADVTVGLSTGSSRASSAIASRRPERRKRAVHVDRRLRSAKLGKDRDLGVLGFDTCSPPCLVYLARVFGRDRSLVAAARGSVCEIYEDGEPPVVRRDNLQGSLRLP